MKTVEDDLEKANKIAVKILTKVEGDGGLLENRELGDLASKLRRTVDQTSELEVGPVREGQKSKAKSGRVQKKSQVGRPMAQQGKSDNPQWTSHQKRPKDKD